MSGGLSWTQCVSESSRPWRFFSCPHNHLIHIQRAFLLAVVANDSAHCRHQPISDADHAHCVVGDVTPDVIAACAMFTNCRMSSDQFSHVNNNNNNNCSGLSEHWSRSIYLLHIDYNCLSGMTWWYFWSYVCVFLLPALLYLLEDIVTRYIKNQLLEYAHISSVKELLMYGTNCLAI